MLAPRVADMVPVTEITIRLQGVGQINHLTLLFLIATTLNSGRAARNRKDNRPANIVTLR